MNGAGALVECPAGELVEALTRFEAGRCAVHQAELDLIWTIEQKGGFVCDGAATMPAWLCLRFGWSSHRAHRTVRVARALAGLPLVRDAYGQGRISFEHVEALCRDAGPDNEAELLGHALQMTAPELKALLAGNRPVEPADANRAHEQRYLRWFWDDEQRVLRLRGMLADVDGKVVATALDLLADRNRSQAGTAVPRPDFEQACADAVVELCSTYLHTAGDAERATVVVHVDVDRLQGAGTGIASLENGPMICGETALRLACDCRHELVIDGPEREPIGIGRRSRQIPGWLWRVLRHRDRTCRFPGCDRTRWCQGHHIRHWTRNGPTDADNLVVLCWFHHRLVHEGGWTVKGNADEWLDFIDPAGCTLTSLPPPPVDPAIKDDLLELFSGEPPPDEEDP